MKSKGKRAKEREGKPRENQKRKEEKKREEEPMPMRFWLSNEKIAKGRGFLLLWSFLSKGIQWLWVQPR